jgi:hypothetical protein
MGERDETASVTHSIRNGRGVTDRWANRVCDGCSLSRAFSTTTSSRTRDAKHVVPLDSSTRAVAGRRMLGEEEIHGSHGHILTVVRFQLVENLRVWFQRRGRGRSSPAEVLGKR